MLSETRGKPQSSLTVGAIKGSASSELYDVTVDPCSREDRSSVSREMPLTLQRVAAARMGDEESGVASANAPSTVQVLGTILLYCTISIVLIFTNKWVMTGEGTSIPAPLFVTWVQCAYTISIILALGHLKSRVDLEWLQQFPDPVVDLSVSRKVLPLSVIFVIMVAANNFCLYYVEVSFYNVAKALSLLFNVGFGYALLGSTVSMRVAATICVVITGFLLGIDGEVNFTLVGTLFGLVSSAASPLNSIFTKKVLPAVDGDKWQLALYNNLNAFLLFMPLIVVTNEISTIREHSHILFSLRYWAGVSLTGFLAFAIGIAVVLMIKTTSPLSFNIAGVGKNSLQTVLAVYIWRTPMTSRSVLGVSLVLGGSLAYGWVKHAEATHRFS